MLFMKITLSVTLLVTFSLNLQGQEEERVYASKYHEAERLYQLAVEHLDAQRPKNALDLLNRAVSYQSDYVDAYHQRAMVKHMLKDTQGALTDYEIVLHLDSTFTEAAFERAKLRFLERQYMQAIEEFDHVLTMPQTGTRRVYFKGAQLNSTDQPAINSLTTAYSLDGDIYNYQGLSYHALGQYQRAIGYFDKAVQHNSQEANYLVNRGLSKIELGETSTAIEDFKKALILDPNNAVAEFNLTQEMESSGALEVEVYDEMIEKHPDFASPYVNRALAKLHNGDLEGALKDYDKAVEVDPHDARIRLNRALSREKAGLLQAALKDLNRALALDPSLTAAYRSRGRILSTLQQYTLAVEDFTEAIRLEPQHAPSYFNRALVFRKLQQNDSCCTDLEKAESLGLDVATKALDAYCITPHN